MIFIGFIIVTIFGLLRYILPNSETVSVAKGKLDKSEFSSAYFKIYPIAIVTAVSFSFLFKEIFNSCYSKPTDAYQFNLLPGRDYWILVAIIIGLFSGLSAFFIMVKILFQDKSAYFWANYESMYNFRAKTVLTGAWLLIGITAIALTITGQNTYFLVGKNEIRIRQFMEFNERAYTYSDVKEINFKEYFLAPNGDIKNIEHYEIIFEDGYSWKSKSTFREPQDNDIKFVEFISRHSLKPIKK